MFCTNLCAVFHRFHAMTSLLQRTGCEGLILFVCLVGFPLIMYTWYFYLYGSGISAAVDAHMPFLIRTLNPGLFVRWKCRLKVMFC